MRRQRKSRGAQISLLPLWLLLVFLTVNTASSFASISKPVTIEHQLPPKSSEFEISTWSFSGLQTRNEIPAFSVVVSCKVLVHNNLQKMQFCHSLMKKRIFKSKSISEIIYSQRLAQDYYTLAVGCLRL